VTCYDVFNGDADGLCALRQLRLHAPRDAVLVTGVKRDIRLLDRVPARAGDEILVLDVALEANRKALECALAAGATCSWFDHHFPGPIPSHPALDAHIRYAPDTCTSLLVDDHLGGRWRRWAVAAAFGDGLPGPAAAAAATLQLCREDIGMLRQVGQVINYNAYGESVADLHFAPDALYRILERYADPLEFARGDPAFLQLLEGWREDMAQASVTPAAVETDTHLMVVLPDAAWARRASGPWASEAAGRTPQRAVAVLVPARGAYVVSIRAPAAHPHGADALAREFPSGGGRPGAAGINALPVSELERFAARFTASFTQR
jgi:hypothetical protein